MVRSAAQKLVLIHSDSTDHALELEANEPPPSLTLMDLVDAVGQCADTEEDLHDSLGSRPDGSSPRRGCGTRVLGAEGRPRSPDDTLVVDTIEPCVSLLA
jgi:hypothetical protein